MLQFSKSPASLDKLNSLPSYRPHLFSAVYGGFKGAFACCVFPNPFKSRIHSPFSILSSAQKNGKVTILLPTRLHIFLFLNCLIAWQWSLWYLPINSNRFNFSTNLPLIAIFMRKLVNVVLWRLFVSFVQ